MTFRFEWQKDFSIRCTTEDLWIDFSFDIGGGKHDLLLFRRPARKSDHHTEDVEEAAFSQLCAYLEGLGYQLTVHGN